MMKWTKDDWILLSCQLVSWLLLWLIPAAIAFLTELSDEAAWGILRRNGEFILWYSGFYFLNFYGMAPYLLVSKRTTFFLLGKVTALVFHLLVNPWQISIWLPGAF